MLLQDFTVNEKNTGTRDRDRIKGNRKATEKQKSAERQKKEKGEKAKRWSNHFYAFPNLCTSVRLRANLLKAFTDRGAGHTADFLYARSALTLVSESQCSASS